MTRRKEKGLKDKQWSRKHYRVNKRSSNKTQNGNKTQKTKDQITWNGNKTQKTKDQVTRHGNKTQKKKSIYERSQYFKFMWIFHDWS